MKMVCVILMMSAHLICLNIGIYDAAVVSKILRNMVIHVPVRKIAVEHMEPERYSVMDHVMHQFLVFLSAMILYVSLTPMFVVMYEPEK